MIRNIIDRRERPYRWRYIQAIIEPTWHDNSCHDSDQSDRTTHESDYEERNGISLYDAICWAMDVPYYVTVYLYDEGCGTKEITFTRHLDSNGPVDVLSGMAVESDEDFRRRILRGDK